MKIKWATPYENRMGNAKNLIRVQFILKIYNMSKTLISLVGEHPIPNLLMIKEFAGTVNKYIFITESDREAAKQTGYFLKALNIPESKVEIINVEPESADAIEKTLFAASFKDDEEYYVNLTGGSKLCALTVLNFFREFYSANIFLVHKGTEMYSQIYPRIERSESSFINSLTLYEYLTGTGIKKFTKEKLHKSPETTSRLMGDVILAKGNLKRVKKIREWQKTPSDEDKRYYSGGWFEEYIYNTVKKHFDLEDKDIGVSVKIQDEHSRNEFDVMFVRNSKIHAIECKAFQGRKGLKTKVEGALYKLGALDDAFGQRVHTSLCITSDLDFLARRASGTLKRRAEDLNVNLIQFDDIQTDRFLKKI